jgi:hypothetical protein
VRVSVSVPVSGHRNTVDHIATSNRCDDAVHESFACPRSATRGREVQPPQAGAFSFLASALLAVLAAWAAWRLPDFRLLASFWMLATNSL